MSGAYRHVVVRPQDVSWSVVRYSDPVADLVLSDWDLLQPLTGIVPGTPSLPLTVHALD
jgi:hypothetical protein